MRRLLARSAMAGCLAWASLAGAAQAAPRVKLSASFSPERLGGTTTIGVGFQLAYQPTEAPLPVTDVQLALPAGLGIATSDLGLENCLANRLQRLGAPGCPQNSLIGRGEALAEVPFGSHFVLEPVRIELFSAPLQAGHPQLLFLASGSFPVIADLVFSSVVVPAQGRFGGVIDTSLPLVPSVPEGPDVALTRLHTTIGPAGITYRERVADRIVSFHPSGVRLPARCPHGGFLFSVRLTFVDGSLAQASTAIPCPRKSHGLRRPDDLVSLRTSLKAS